MRNLVFSVIALLVSGLVSAQSQLPQCQGNAVASWNNCFGRWLNLNGDKYEGEWRNGKPHGQGIHSFRSGEKYVGSWVEGKYEGVGTLTALNGSIISQGNWIANKLFSTSQDPNTAQTNDAVRNENERKAAQMEAERIRIAKEIEKAKQAVPLSLVATVSAPNSYGEVALSISTNVEAVSLTIDGEEQERGPGGLYTAIRTALAGQETKFVIEGRDKFGNATSKELAVFRPLIDGKEIFPRLNASNLRPQRPRDAVAIIIGIQDYQRVPKAEFAKNDALAFYDYVLRMGLKPENINLLLDAQADDISMLKAFKNWLPVRVNRDKTEVFVFFSGHGLPSDDGKLYLLPYGVDKDLLERTALAQKEIVAHIQSAKPKSVTMFFDSCYSGQTRGGSTLLASARPLSIKSVENAFPDNFTVMSASANSQISSSSPDLKHGIFSYYLMKGLEGEADGAKDGTITVGKLQNYIFDKVSRFAMKMNRTQEPQLIGDSAKVLVSN
jgi:hypothetical protein